MNICFVCNQYPPLPPGGHGARTNVLAKALLERGHKVTVVGVVPRNFGIPEDVDETIEGVRVIRLIPAPRFLRWRPGELWGRWRLSQRIRRLHRAQPLDLVDCPDSFGWTCFGGAPGVPMTVRFAATCKLYASLGQFPAEPFSHALEARALARGSHFYAPSRWAADETLKVFGYEETPCEVIHNAVDVDLFSPGKQAECEPGLIVYSGGIEPRKGIRELLASMNIWGRSHPSTRLVLVGGDCAAKCNGKSFTESCLEGLDADLRGRVHFTGPLDRNSGLLSWLRSAQICVFPSHVETFGIAPVEAMSLGKPVLYSRIGPGLEIIEDRTSGLLCDPLQPSDIAAKIQEMLNRPDWAAGLGEQARATVLRRFNHRHWAETCEGFYERCIAEFRERPRYIGPA